MTTVLTSTASWSINFVDIFGVRVWGAIICNESSKNSFCISQGIVNYSGEIEVA
jgi:hypothetical protein